MKALSLMQPWASLLALGVKKLETRSRRWNYQGDFLIHASQKMNATAIDVANRPEVIDIFQEFKISELPRGKIIGAAHITDCRSTNEFGEFISESSMFWPPKRRGVSYHDRANEWGKNWEFEQSLGDFSPGRFFYEIVDPVLFPVEHQHNARGQVLLGWEFEERICYNCGCTESNCEACIKRTGQPCFWLDQNLCSACADSEHNHIRAPKNSDHA